MSDADTAESGESVAGEVESARGWVFDFVLEREGGELLTIEARELLDRIIGWAEERGLSVGGGVRPAEEDVVDGG